MRKVRATQRIKHDGIVYEEGDVLVVDNILAKRFEAYGVIEKKEKKEETPETNKAVDYSKMKLGELIDLAKKRNVAGASKLGKKDLVEILTEQDKV